MISPTEEDFELELRALPGVVNVGFRYGEKGDVDAVSLVVHGDDAGPVRVVAKQIVSLYYPNATVSVEEMKPVAAPARGTSSDSGQRPAHWWSRSHAGRLASTRLRRSLLPSGLGQRGHGARLAGHRDLAASGE